MKKKKIISGIPEKIFKILLYTGDILKVFISLLTPFLVAVFSLISLLFFLLFAYQIGFEHDELTSIKIRGIFRVILILLFITKLTLSMLSFDRKRLLSFTTRVTILLFCLLVILSNSVITQGDSAIWAFFRGNGMMIGAGFMLILLEISRFFDLISSVNFPPVLVFSTSFLVIILIGAGMLMLPNSRTVPVSFLDSIFTSVSAVCVTGLTVVNTDASFTLMGKVILMCLMQIGGLGMMTFTGFFSYIFTSKSTLQERMLLQDIFSSESMGNLFKILIKIVLFTFLVESAGALIIYFSLSESMDGRGFFSLFHSVSAFCNAGFSTLPGNMMSPEAVDNYVILSSISVLIIIGGLGFPVILRLYAILKSKVIIIYDNISRKKYHTRIERLDAGSKIVISTTFFLLLAGMLIFFAVERKASMTGMKLPDQLFLSFFNSVTVRTAGFNMSDLTLLGYPAIFLFISLMWIGASPGSTGGGIKTSAFTIAVRSAWSNIRGQKSLEIGNREINPGTINRVLSIIILSLLVISTGFFFLLISDPGKNPVHLLFESVSAYSTVGLSLADTSTLSKTGKSIIILLMFIGRVGPLTLLTGIFISGSKKHYQYPSGDIAIN